MSQDAKKKFFERPPWLSDGSRLKFLAAQKEAEEQPNKSQKKRADKKKGPEPTGEGGVAWWDPSCRINGKRDDRAKKPQRWEEVMALFYLEILAGRLPEPNMNEAFANFMLSKPVAMLLSNEVRNHCAGILGRSAREYRRAVADQIESGLNDVKYLSANKLHSMLLGSKKKGPFVNLSLTQIENYIKAYQQGESVTGPMAIRNLEIDLNTLKADFDRIKQILESNAMLTDKLVRDGKTLSEFKKFISGLKSANDSINDTEDSSDMQYEDESDEMEDVSLPATASLKRRRNIFGSSLDTTSTTCTTCSTCSSDNDDINEFELGAGHREQKNNQRETRSSKEESTGELGAFVATTTSVAPSTLSSVNAADEKMNESDHDETTP